MTHTSDGYSLLRVDASDPSTLDYLTGIGQVLAVMIAAAAAYYAARSASAAERAVEAQSRPLLIDVPYGIGYDLPRPIRLPNGEPRDVSVSGQILTSPEEGWISIPLRNVGAGVAVIFSVRARVAGRSAWRASIAMQAVDPRNLGPGEETRIGVQLGSDQAAKESLRHALERGGPVEVEITYFDFAWRQRQLVIASVGHQGDPPIWRVAWVSTRTREDEIPEADGSQE